MEWKYLSKDIAAEEYKNIIIDGTFSPICTEKYIQLKKELRDVYDSLKESCKIENGEVLEKYKFDCYFGLKLYEILSKQEFYLREHDAANDSIWRYLQLYVIPDIVKSRVGEKEDAFYKRSNRLYLKRIWWYIHLSMYNYKFENAKSIILNPCNNTDTIVQLVERSGNHGYRVELYRTIMYFKSLRNVSQDAFRRILVLNSAKVKVIDPYLDDGGIAGYVNKLFEEVL